MQQQMHTKKGYYFRSNLSFKRLCIQTDHSSEERGLYSATTCCCTFDGTGS